MPDVVGRKVTHPGMPILSFGKVLLVLMVLMVHRGEWALLLLVRCHECVMTD